ncbi:Myb/SANT-like domain containing protein [Trema orientale]|uniref:Myb/SANT-like domain containing protein n=1 Tax=Trema orientale TaxID=63057 RepID=A0A2P5EDH2_TREOI|nr:Myb/SANT-like domain containing protein [Trema orientale]
MESSKGKGPGQNKRFWTTDEDNKLIKALLEIHNEGKFKAEGNFKAGHLIAIERYLEVQLPGCGLKAKPHIESRMKTLKAQFYIVHEMLTGPNCSGFGWDADRKLVYAEKPVWEAYLQVFY